MPLERVRFNLKIFMINKSHHELVGLSNQEIIETIKDNHKRGMLANEENLQVTRPNLKSYSEGAFHFWTYCYNEPKDQNYWTLFLPDELVSGHNFEIVEFSFVLFILYNESIYCVIGGSGVNVIRKYCDRNFGIDLYQHFAKPAEDVIIGLSTRGVAGNISQKSNTFNFNQTINQSVDFSDIPKRIRIVVRKELREGIFKKYDLDSNNPLMEIGAYFSLRKKIDYEQLKELIIDIDTIRQDKSNYNQLTLFKKITDDELLKGLDNHLKDKMADDVVLHNTPDRLILLNDDIIEIVNPYKLEKFYECDSYRLRFKHARTENFITVTNRNRIYFEATRLIFQSMDDFTKRDEIKGKFYKLNIIGVIDGKEVTFGHFFSHVTSEIPYLSKKYFRVDEQWYFLEDKFIEQMSSEAVSTYTQYKLSEPLLNSWNGSKDEDFYNKTHNLPGYYILDKVISDNVELCDILTLKSDAIYFTHVKNGFNTQMRNLYIQVILAAKRLWNDMYNNEGSSYFKSTLELYNQINPTNQFDTDAVFQKIVSGELKVVFVMAFHNHYYKDLPAIEKIKNSESNIAKYSLIQTVREMKDFRKFDIKVLDISEV